MNSTSVTHLAMVGKSPNGVVYIHKVLNLGSDLSDTESLTTQTNLTLAIIVELILGLVVK